jgi:hypothetical protein
MPVLAIEPSLVCYYKLLTLRGPKLSSLPEKPTYFAPKVWNEKVNCGNVMSVLRLPSVRQGEETFCVAILLDNLLRRPSNYH